MQQLKDYIKQLFTTAYLLKWIALAVPVSLVTGSLVALFLWSLDWATQFRWQHPWLLLLLPVSGLVIHFLYKLYGKDSERGNNLVIDEIHTPGGGVPPRMAPLVIVTTIITHFFGGSAGREGTAVQVGGSMAAAVGKLLKLSTEDTQTLLMMGIAAGFGAVFGTPLAGSVFAVEVLIVGKIRGYALLPCVLAAYMADVVCNTWGIHHTAYHIALSAGAHKFLYFDSILIAKVIMAGVAFGMAAQLFALLSHQIKAIAIKYVPILWLIPVIGGAIIIGLTFLLGTYDYLGLGVVSQAPNGISIVNAFHVNGVATWSWLWKLVFTIITLSMGFKGGEVTPLFFIGAALGNTLAALTCAPVDLLAGLGFVAVFAGATNTPVACTLMGIELFGAEYGLYYAIACFVAFWCNGKKGIYAAQKRI